MAAMRRPTALAVLLLALVPAGAGAIASPQRGVKILGGAVAAPGQFPFMAALMDSRARHAIDGVFCGGSLIAPQVVLTAGHCVEGTNASEMDVVVGRIRLSDETGGVRIHVTKIVPYPTYNSETVTGDVALLRLAQPAPVAAIAPAPTGGGTAQSPGTRVMTIGWGATSEGGNVSDELRFVRLTVRSHRYCDDIYGPIRDNSQLCIGSSRAGADSCQGDSGGPVIAGDGDATRLIGAGSYGQGCGHVDTPGGYSRVSYFARWIEDQAALLNGNAPPPPPVDNAPVVRIGRIACGPVYCNVTLRTSGRVPAGGIVLDYVRHRSGGRKAVDEFVVARQ